MASGIAFRLYQSNFRNICMTEISHPLAVRREVSFCEAVHEKEKIVQGIGAHLAESSDKISSEWEKGKIPVFVDEECSIINIFKPDILIDAILAKRNMGTKKIDAELVIGVGPGFFAGRDVHVVVETNRGHDMGKVITWGEAEENTDLPGTIEGYGPERVLRSPCDGVIKKIKEIGELVKTGDLVAMVDDRPVKASIPGVLRGLIRTDSNVHKDMKIGDIDPRGKKEYCYTISDKALAIGGGVLEAILAYFNK